jgi:hypothetical protein
VFKNRVLRKIFGLQKQANLDLQGLYSLPSMMRDSKPKRIRRSRLVACMVGIKIAYRILDGSPEG